MEDECLLEMIHIASKTYVSPSRATSVSKIHSLYEEEEQTGFWMFICNQNYLGTTDMCGNSCYTLAFMKIEDR